MGISNSKLSTIKDPLHHAYLIEGEEDAVGLVEGVLSEMGYETAGNPDFRVHRYREGLGIEDARGLRAAHLSKPVSGDKKLFILWVPSATTEAQNALLKIFEEPSGASHFFIISPRSGVFLPTVLSRVEVVRRESGLSEGLELEEAKKLLKMSARERIDELEPVIKEKDKKKAAALLSGLEVVLSKELEKNPGNNELKEALKEVLKFEGYMKGRSPSIKMILEHLALALPKI